MKLLYLPLNLILLLFFACSSPAAKKPQDTAPKADTTATMDTSAAVATASSATTVGQSTVFPDESLKPYGLDTVKSLMKKVKFEEDSSGGDGGTEALDDKTYASLSFEQKFTYHMIHPESFSQNCDILPERKDEANRIYGHLPDIFGEYEWSERQLNFFKNNRLAVEKLMKPIIQKGNTIGANYEEAIVEMNAKEMIPFLIDYYNRQKKDHYILTVLMLLMKNNQYPEFMNSTSYTKLYGSEDGEYSAYLVYNKANEDLIFKRAMNFYNGLSK